MNTPTIGLYLGAKTILQNPGYLETLRDRIGLNLVILLFVSLLFKELVASSFDESYAVTRGVPVHIMHLAMVGLIALAVVMMMRVVGLIMVIALLTMPAAIAVDWVKDVRRAMALAIALSASFVIAGLALSYSLDLTSGATIILVAGVAYLLSLGALRWRGRARAGHRGAAPG